MKKYLYIIASALLLSVAASCDRPFNEQWDSLYYTDEEGARICRLIQEYKLKNDGSEALAIAVYYSGTWTVEFVDEPDWAFIREAKNTGVHYFHVDYAPNETGTIRYVTLRINCDNGETCDIDLSQESMTIIK